MCGITGFINFTSTTSKLDEQVLAKMSHSLLHRGPDDIGIKIFKNEFANIGLGHRRLSIIDLSKSGHQPMIVGNDNYSIVFNGEVYNYKEIRAKLESLGYDFNSTSDTEVVLKSYIAWGMKAVESFIGMFAFT